jgi:transcriptional regulator with XRE-family HTH domain
MPTSGDDREQLVRVRRAALGSRLRQLRAARGLTAEAVARRAGIDRSFYSEIELGKLSPRVDFLWDIAAALGVPASDLLREPP